jgi:tight adherence protein C
VPITVYLASFSVVGGIGLLWWSLGGSRRSADVVRANLRMPNIATSITPDRDVVSRNVRSFAGRLPGFLSLAELDRRLAGTRFGRHWTAERVFLIKLALAAAVLTIGIGRAVAGGSAGQLPLFFVGAFVAFLVPDLHIAGKAKDHARQLEMQLPDLLDRLTVTIEAGLGFDSALSHVIEAGEGPIFDEFRHVLQDIRLGVPRDLAMKALSERTASADLKHFAASLNQATAYGLPMATVMRTQSADLREKRRFRAEERAMKIPVKIVFPLVLCILPTIFIVLLAPALINIKTIL